MELNQEKTMARTPPAVSSFGPELLALLLKGAKEKVTLPSSEKKKARRLHFRLNSLRKAMREERHPLYSLVSKVEIHTERVEKAGNTEQAKVTVAPADNSFVDLIKQAGVDVDEELSKVGEEEIGKETEAADNVGVDNSVEETDATTPVLDAYFADAGENEDTQKRETPDDNQPPHYQPPKLVE